MVGVNRADKLLSYCGFCHRTVKWCRRPFFHLLHLFVVSTYILHRQYKAECCTHKQFCTEPANALRLKDKQLDKHIPDNISCTSKFPCCHLSYEYVVLNLLYRTSLFSKRRPPIMLQLTIIISIGGGNTYSSMLLNVMWKIPVYATTLTKKNTARDVIVIFH